MTAELTPPLWKGIVAAWGSSGQRDFVRATWGTWHWPLAASLAGCTRGSASGSIFSVRGWIFFVYLVATVEALIAAALILGFARKITYVSAAGFSFLIWSTAEGFGGPYTAGSTDVGASIIYVVVFLGLLALNLNAAPACFC